MSIFLDEGYVNDSCGIVVYNMLESSARWRENTRDAVRLMDHVVELHPLAIYLHANSLLCMFYSLFLIRQPL